MKLIQNVFRISQFVVVFLLVTSCTNTASAKVPAIIQANETSGKKTLSPYFVVISEHPETDRLPLKSTKAEVNIVGVIADVSIKQTYVNSGKNTLEAIYTFPLSTKAAVYAMKMTIGTRTITAKISEKEKARKDYKKAKAAGKRVSLLEQNRPNVFTMKVANISVNDTIVVEMRYTELLIPESGVYSFVYPTVVGPRYSNKTKSNSANDDKFVASPFTQEGEMPTYKFGIKMKINAAIPIQDVTCSTHKMTVLYPDLNSATVNLDKSESNGGNRDVIVHYTLQGNNIESGVMLYEHGDEKFFLLMVQPPKKVMADEIPAREYIFIMDVSGSMDGFPISISKKLLRNLILNLHPTDKFNVVLFAGNTGLLSEKSIAATSANVDRAIKLIESQQGGGGTELLSALNRAYAIPRS
ncbi:MAG: VIT and VWA domain-containing protein, partial [Paludibacter sp.]